MSVKIRRVDFYPDEYIAGVSGLLPADQGIYWMICSLIYSQGGLVDDNPKRLARLFLGSNARGVRGAIDRLVAAGKIERVSGQLCVRRCTVELQFAYRRIAVSAENGRKGGRPTKETKEIEKAGGSFPEKLTTNYQPPTIEKEDIILGSISKKKTPPKRAPHLPAGYAELSRVLDDERTKAVIEHRQKFKKPLTAHAAKLLAQKFEQCPNPNEAADEMVARGWQGFKPEWLQQANAKPVPGAQPPPHQYDPNIPPERLAEMLADIEREFGGRRIR